MRRKHACSPSGSLSQRGRPGAPLFRPVDLCAPGQVCAILSPCAPLHLELKPNQTKPSLDYSHALVRTRAHACAVSISNAHETRQRARAEMNKGVSLGDDVSQGEDGVSSAWTRTRPPSTPDARVS
jgi:hypothetical protein